MKETTTPAQPRPAPRLIAENIAYESALSDYLANPTPETEKAFHAASDAWVKAFLALPPTCPTNTNRKNHTMKETTAATSLGATAPVAPVVATPDLTTCHPAEFMAMAYSDDEARRILHCLSEPMIVYPQDAEDVARCVEAIGEYNAFDPATIVPALGPLSAALEANDIALCVRVGREGSPVLYLSLHKCGHTSCGTISGRRGFDAPDLAIVGEFFTATGADEFSLLPAEIDSDRHVGETPPACWKCEVGIGSALDGRNIATFRLWWD